MTSASELKALILPIGLLMPAEQLYLNYWYILISFYLSIAVLILYDLLTQRTLQNPYHPPWPRLNCFGNEPYVTRPSQHR